MPSLRTNEDALVEMAVSGVITTPAVRPGQYIPYPDGKATVLPGMFGITYNVMCGDRAFGWAGDHVEPGVSIDDEGDSGRHHALHYLNCIGNDAVVTSGMAAGERGIVVGEHARILVQFSPEAHEVMAPGDRIQVMTKGQGFALTDYPGVALKKMSPKLFHAMGVTEKDGRLQVKVAMELPIRIMGSGAELNSEYVDQDLMSGDRALMAELGIDQMRLGDLIAIRHADHHWGRSYRKDAVSICLCIHGDSIMTGHGPGILTLMTARDGEIDFTVDASANIADLLNIGA
ncbi:DUF4438 domain-containing protein [Gymnodinialimonas ceratoperidinii]|uniref:DUF4438 domain-containing protein n=1 Tax=Gymnodinialimonas ceratoperidinii TaxID=2856823 RepID=A0A8F6TYV4_9RHOB|nr:DUF4438 domain-containing protein [Gymnodinialimonas ceratoperidinii]QXT40262.1 DUF4438 domain-containing protein [Gymnodinialimonas ceratoperidinii]